MEREAVESSNIVSVGYDPNTRILEVEFKGAALYRYLDVPPEIYLELRASASKGSFLNCNIKPHYSYERVG
jgi:hypothetical protein